MTSAAIPVLVDGSTAGASRSRAAGSLSVPADPSGCTAARHWTTTQLSRLGLTSSGLRDDAELVVSELVSNAVLHGAAPVVVTLTADATGLTVTVSDSGGPPYLFDGGPADPTASHGRGLAIVRVVATAWGIRVRNPGPGKDVWCHLSDTATTGDAR